MKQLRTLSDLGAGPRQKPIVAAAGFFDGVHLGHQAILRTAVQHAQERNGEAWVLTFDTHPLRILNPDAAPPLLTSTRHKLLLLERLPLHGCLLLPFTRTTADTPADTFIANLLDHAPPLVELVVGGNWRFGQHGHGNPALLARRSRSRGAALEVNVTAAKRWKGETISSTRIRSAVLSGRIDQAASMLGRPFSVLGTVVPGERIGRHLGYPTANLDTHNEALPPFGVYTAFAAPLASSPLPARQPACVYPSIVNFGIRPTLARSGRQTPVLEVHLLDAERDLYGQDMEVFFIHKLRDERSFASAHELRAQIENDIVSARAELAGGPAKKLKESLYIR